MVSGHIYYYSVKIYRSINDLVHPMIISGCGMHLMLANLTLPEGQGVVSNSRLSPDTMVVIFHKWVSVGTSLFTK